MMTRWAPRSLRAQLLVGILVPVLVLVAVNTVSLYRQALRAADTAYDRTLLATAKSIGEELRVEGRGAQARLQAAVSYSALEAFEADNRSRLYYKVSGFAGETVSGFDLPPWHGKLPLRGPYAALVDFYDDRYRDEPVRVAVLLQPVAGTEARGMATIQVAETLELRQTLARQILIDTLWRQAALLAVITLVVLVVVQRATQPVSALSERIAARSEQDLAPLEAVDAPRELMPLIDATNQVMGRLAHLLAHQKRFVRDTSHQLRTPLAVLKAQVQSALRGDVAPTTALHEMAHTVERATQLANQMLALAKVEQVAQQDAPGPLDLAALAREVALDVAPLAADKALDFGVEADAPVCVQGHAWMLRELTRNLLHNAIRACPPGGHLTLTVQHDEATARLLVRDSGPGIAPALRERLFEPFHSGDSHGSGLGLAICREVCERSGAQIALTNRVGHNGSVQGLDALVTIAGPAALPHPPHPLHHSVAHAA
jgi:two-component system sensor histidine kinase TctE